MIEITNLSKTYGNGGTPALQEINLRVREGEFPALLGLNGAGKSTLINILAGNVKKSSGTVRIGGYDLDRNPLETKRILGIVPQELSFEILFTVEEILKRQSGYFGIRHNGRHIDDLLEALSLQEKKKVRAKDLSGGMKRRLLIAKALVHKPKILILDEPTAGIDIELRHSTYRFLESLHREGTTLILTTHYIEEAERLCPRIVIIDRGRLITDEPKEQLLSRNRGNIRLSVETGRNFGSGDLDDWSDFHPRSARDRTLDLELPPGRLKDVLAMLGRAEWDIHDISIGKQSLEDVYLGLVNK